ncbi:putative protein SHORT HYPOCOTYL IN WHITE LIGHT 1 [Helianthus anomalus]
MDQEAEHPAADPRNWSRNRMTFYDEDDDDEDDDDEEEEEGDRSLDLLGSCTRGVVCTLGTVVFVSILLVRGVWTGISYYDFIN